MFAGDRAAGRTFEAEAGLVSRLLECGHPTIVAVPRGVVVQVPELKAAEPVPDTLPGAGTRGVSNEGGEEDA